MFRAARDQRCLRIHIAVANVCDGKVDIRRVPPLDWNIDHHRAPGGFDVARGHHIAQLRRHQQVSFVSWQHRQHVRGFARLVRFLVGNQLDGAIVLFEPNFDPLVPRSRLR